MLKKIKIVVVDDQTLIREGIGSMLSLQDDFDVLATGSNGEEAVSLFIQYKPDILLMDIQMPKINGIEATRQIRLVDPDAKIIMLTTFDEHNYVTRSLKEGAIGYLLKDIQIEELAQAIRLANKGIYQLAGGITEKLTESKTDIPETEDSKAERKEFLLYYNNMTLREKEVLFLLSQGYTNKKIAEELNLSSGTVKNYVSNILNAFDLKDRTQAALLAARYKKEIKEDLKG